MKKNDNGLLRRIPLSVAIITFNEEKNLPACLASVAFADQIVVVDSASSDATVDIAEAFGCDVFQEPWRGFGPQKQFAVDHCRNPWVLILDADERVPSETAAVIRTIVESRTDEFVAFSFPRKNYFQGRWIRTLGWWPDRVVRLFRKEYGSVSAAQVHEAVEVQGPIRDLEVSLEHWTASDLQTVLDKINRYSTLGAAEAFAAGKRSEVWGAALRGMLTFMHNYFVRLGFLDGSQGFTLSITDGVNKFFKYAKLSELNRKNKI